MPLDHAPWMAIAIDAVLFALYFGQIAWNHRSNNQRATRSDLGKFESRVATIEEQLTHTPTHQDISAIKESIAGLRGELGARIESLNQSMTAQQHQMALINDHLRQKN